MTGIQWTQDPSGLLGEESKYLLSWVCEGKLRILLFVQLNWTFNSLFCAWVRDEFNSTHAHRQNSLGSRWGRNTDNWNIFNVKYYTSRSIRFPAVYLNQQRGTVPCIARMANERENAAVKQARFSFSFHSCGKMRTAISFIVWKLRTAR